jgi:hypothetical protein
MSLGSRRGWQWKEELQNHWVPPVLPARLRPPQRRASRETLGESIL